MMTAPARTPNFAANEHVYLLPHVTKDIFQIRACSTIENRGKLLDPTLYNLEGASVLLFEESPSGPGSSKAVALLRKLAAPYKTPESSREGLWYQASGRLEVLRGFLHQVEPAAYVALRAIVPKDPIERADQEDEEREFLRLREEQRYEEACKQRQILEAEQKAEAAAKKEEAAQAARELVASGIEHGLYLAPTHQPEKLLSSITKLFHDINQHCGGFCELKRSSPEVLHLNFYVRRTEVPAVAELIEALWYVLLLNRDPKTSGDGAFTYSRPFCRETPTPIRAKTTGVTHKAMAILTPQPWFRDLILSLKPGIRGWDLPLDAAVLNYDPNFDAIERLGRKIPPKGCLVKDLWEFGTSCLSPEAVHYMKGYGVKLDWDHGNLRFVAKSPVDQDEGAPLLLLRLILGTKGVGVQKIRLDTGARETLAFADCDARNAIGSLWRPKSHVLVVTCLEDALAANASARKPCIVVPSPQALAEFDWPEGTTSLTALLPANNPEPWQEALAAFRKRVGASGFQAVHVFPKERSSCLGWPYPAEWARQFMRETQNSR